jgi:protein gp37
MADQTAIAWTDHTFNPWMGCAKVSEGCRNCYALTLTKNRMGLEVFGNNPRKVTKKPWKDVRSWNGSAPENAGVLGPDQPDLVFCASLCDVFEDHPTANETRPLVWDLIRELQNLHFQILTKRPERILDNLPSDWGSGWHNVWIGTSIEDMRVARRADILREVPAVVRFISYEPALGPLDDLNLEGIDWLIYGGESGPGYRPEGTAEDPKVWARTIGQRCEEFGVAYFHKQSAAHRTEMGIELDGQIVRKFPVPRPGTVPQLNPQLSLL